MILTIRKITKAGVIVFFKFLSEKLVRDKTVERYTEQGGSLTYRILENDAEYERELNKKLLEEAKEVIAAKNRLELIAELADTQEVLNAIAKHHKIDLQEIEAVRLEKSASRGSFDNRIYSAIGMVQENSPLAKYILESPEKYIRLDDQSFFKELVTNEMNYKYLFGQCKTELFDALPRDIISILHIGSTTMRQMKTQPIVDMLVIVKTLLTFDINAENILHLGWQPQGEQNIPNRRLFVKKDTHSNIPIAHLNVFEHTDPNAKRFLQSTQKITASEELKAEFSALKEAELSKSDASPESYTHAKQLFFAKVLKNV